MAKKPAAKKAAKKTAQSSVSRRTAAPPLRIAKPPGSIELSESELARAKGIARSELPLEPTPSWTQWRPETFPDGCGMDQSGCPVASLAALNPSPHDCQIVASEMRHREHVNQLAACELEVWSAAPSQFFRKRSNEALAQLRHEIATIVMEAANPDFFSLCRSPAEASKLYDTFVAVGMAGFEFALKRYAHELRDVPELREKFEQLKHQRQQTSQQLNDAKRAKRRKYGSKVMTVAQRNAAIVTELTLLRQSIGNEAARLAVAEKYGLSDRQVANIWRQNRPENPPETS